MNDKWVKADEYFMEIGAIRLSGYLNSFGLLHFMKRKSYIINFDPFVEHVYVVYVTFRNKSEQQLFDRLMANWRNGHAHRYIKENTHEIS